MLLIVRLRLHFCLEFRFHSPRLWFGVNGPIPYGHVWDGPSSRVTPVLIRFPSSKSLHRVVSTRVRGLRRDPRLGSTVRVLYLRGIRRSFRFSSAEENQKTAVFRYYRDMRSSIVAEPYIPLSVSSTVGPPLFRLSYFVRSLRLGFVRTALGFGGLVVAAGVVGGSLFRAVFSSRARSFSGSNCRCVFCSRNEAIFRFLRTWSR